MKNKNYISAIATMVGSIVGAGIFAVPYAIRQAGVLSLLIYLPILAYFGYFLNNIYAEIILSTKERHRMPGYMKKYYGKKLKRVALIMTTIAINLGLLSYLLMGGEFLHELISKDTNNGSSLYVGILFIFGAIVTFSGVKLISKMELIMSIFLFVVMGLLTWRSLSYFSFSNYTVFEWKNFLLPYGPIFFAVAGTSSIPVVCRILSRQKNKIKSAIFWGSVIPASLTFPFALMVVGVTGELTSPEALSGLNDVIGNGVVKITLIFGLLSVVTSFVMNIEALSETYLWDLGWSKNFSWVVAITAPYLLFLIGFNNTGSVISLTGAVGGGLIGIFYMMLGLAVKKKAEKKSPIKTNLNKKIAFLLSLLFLAGVVYELWAILVKSS